MIQEDEQEQPVITTQPQKKKDEEEKEIGVEKQEKETEEEKDRTSSLLGEYSMLDQQFMDVEPVQIPMDTPLIPPPSSKAPSETSEDTIRRPSFDPGEYSYAELDSIRAKKAAAREAQLRKEQAGRGGGAVGGGRGGMAVRGRGGPVMRGRGGPVMRGRGGVVMRGGAPMMRRQQVINTLVKFNLN